jgi:hypothetical protein
VQTIGKEAFRNCHCLLSANIPGSVTFLGQYSFGNCTVLGSISIPGSVKTIDFGAFYECTYLDSVTLGYGIETIGANSFQYLTYLSSISIPGSVKTIDNYAFYGDRNLKKIDIGYGVEKINNYAFLNAQRVTSLVIPESVTALGNNAFGNCSALANVSFSKELIDSIDLENVFPNCPNFHEDGITILKDSIFKATGKTAKVKAKKVKKKAQTVAATSLYTFTPKTGIMVQKVSGNSKFTVNKFNGNITVAKKTKKGTYKIKVKVMSTGNAEYKASDWKTVTVTIKIK